MTLAVDAVHQATQRIERLIDPIRDSMIRRAATSGALAAAAVLAVTAFALAAPDLHPVLANARTCRAAGACAGSRATPQR